jgi:hypothetical protein
MRRLQYLPWRSLLLTAAATVFCLTIISYALVASLQQWAFVRTLFELLYAPGISTVTNLAIAAGVGALAVCFLETLFPQTRINTNVLWSLILCVMVVLILTSLLPIPAGLVSPNTISLVGVVLGVFLLGGRRYWR